MSIKSRDWVLLPHLPHRSLNTGPAEESTHRSGSPWGQSSWRWCLGWWHCHILLCTSCRPRERKTVVNAQENLDLFLRMKEGEASLPSFHPILSLTAMPQSQPDAVRAPTLWIWALKAIKPSRRFNSVWFSPHNQPQSCRKPVGSHSQEEQHCHSPVNPSPPALDTQSPESSTPGLCSKATQTRPPLTAPLPTLLLQFTCISISSCVGPSMWISSRLGRLSWVRNTWYLICLSSRADG